MVDILRIDVDDIQFRNDREVRPEVSEYFHKARERAFRRVDTAKVTVCVIPALVTGILPVCPRQRLRYAPDPV